jgi:2-C-methyl-D-erythritol 2,4-cyclodiphosphate synthase
MNVRVGFGFDVHRLQEGREFWLGGIKIPHSRGALGHSDADVLIHSVCDALLGAANLRDIGFHFPDTSAEFKDADSKILLGKVVQLLEERKYRIGNIDCTLCLESPKINPYIEQMKETLSPVLGVEKEDISIKATTNEAMGFVGRKEGITSYAVVLIYKSVQT